MLGADHHGYVGRLQGAWPPRFGDDPDAQPRDPHRPAGQPGPRRRAGADEQAGRHRGHPGGPGRGDRRGRRPLRAGPLLGRLSTIDIDLDLWTRQTNDNPVFYVQYAHARIASRAAQRRRARARPRRRRRRSTRRCSTHERESDLLAGARRVPAGGRRAPPSCASRTGSPATWRSWPARYHRFYDDCRVLPRGDEEVTDAAPRPGCGCATPPGTVLRQRPRPARRLRPGADVRAHHEAGAAARPSVAAAGPRRLRAAGRPRTRSTRRSGRAASTAATTARCAWPAVDVRDLARRARHPAVRPRRGRLPRRAAADFADAFAGADVHYAGKAFLCTEVARWIAEEGLRLDVCTGGELAVALRGRLPGRADRAARQQQVDGRAERGGRRRGRPRSSSTPSTRSTGSPRWPRERRRAPRRCWSG